MQNLNINQYAELVKLHKPWQSQQQRLDRSAQEDSVLDLLEQNHELLATLIDRDTDQSTDWIRSIAPVERRRMLHALLNVLPAHSLGSTAIEQLDALLQTELDQRSITQHSELPVVCEYAGTKISLWLGDITELAIDAIVNAANNQLTGCWQPLHSCIDNAIHTRAGVQLRDDCHEIMQAQGHAEPTGHAKLTRAYNLPASFVIHTVGPIVQGTPEDSHRQDLMQTYSNCLEITRHVEQINSIAFCCVSTGVFGYPIEEASQCAIETVKNWLQKNPDKLERVVFTVFSDRDHDVYARLLKL